MFNQIKALSDLRKEIPDAVGYSTYGPVTGLVSIPVEIRNNIPSLVAEQLEDLKIIRIDVDNFSTKNQRNIRILFSGEWAFSPRVYFKRRNIEPKYDVRAEDKELVVLEIPPNESIFIELFNPSPDFKVEQVMIGDFAVTSVMQKLAEAKRYPTPTWLRLTTIGASAALALSLFGSGYLWTKISEGRVSRSEGRQIDSALANLPSCKLSVYANKPGNEAALEHKFLQNDPFSQNQILLINKVGTLRELKLKDELIWCEPTNP